ncbi:tRNA (adenosine(37)-N6)-dimethylallyltransferase MiaA [Myxococcota bacterium]|nr:tRNA (adenosine(37)-N6)-dimethylallyltransferase MiaA [Myxococcota bacterium]
MSRPKPLWAVIGPTGSGKSDLAMALAALADAELVSVDSAQIFRGLDVGTAKPTKEEQARIRHHLIDVVEPTEQWSAADFAREADRAIDDIRARGKIPILVGGTGLWLRALVQGLFDAPDIDPGVRATIRAELEVRGAPALHAELAKVDPVAAARIQPTDPQRIGRALEVYRQVGVPISTLQAEHGFRERRHALVAVGRAWSRDALAARIDRRTEVMYRGGILDEVRAALARGVPGDAPGLSIIGYRDAVLHVRGDYTLDEAIAATAGATRRYAKRQRNWFRGVDELEWLDPAEPAEAVLVRLHARSTTL